MSERAEATLYTSCESCAMCAGGQYWAGIGRLVFALSGASWPASRPPVRARCACRAAKSLPEETRVSRWTVRVRTWPPRPSPCSTGTGRPRRPHDQSCGGGGDRHRSGDLGLSGANRAIRPSAPDLGVTVNAQLEDSSRARNAVRLVTVAAGSCRLFSAASGTDLARLDHPGRYRRRLPRGHRPGGDQLGH